MLLLFVLSLLLLSLLLSSSGPLEDRDPDPDPSWSVADLELTRGCRTIDIARLCVVLCHIQLNQDTQTFQSEIGGRKWRESDESK